MVVTLEINGTQREVAESTTLAELLAELDVNTRHVAVEVNRELIPRTEHATHALAEGDQLEIVTLVGGG